MVKQSRKRSRNQKRKSNKNLIKLMVGGDFTPDERNQLTQMGFNDNDINILFDTGVSMDIIRMSLRQINPDTGVEFTPQEIINSVNDVNQENDLDMSGISNVSDDEHNLDNSFMSIDGSFMSNNGSFMSNPDSMNTTREDISNLNASVGSNDSFGEGQSLHLSDLMNESNESNENRSANTTLNTSNGGKRKKRKTIKKRNKTPGERRAVPLQ